MACEEEQDHFDDLDRFSRLITIEEKKDTMRQYAMKRFEPGEPFRLSQSANNIMHSFVAPLMFTLQSPQYLWLYSPFISGGYLFTHLQRARRFDTERSRLYAAEILSALEYLHDTANVVCWLKPGNVMLDAMGHVTLCGFGLFNDKASRDRCPFRGPEYPAPEVLIDPINRTKAGDLWTLGVLLYEMMTGLPPFYSDVPAKIRDNILEGPVQIPASIPPSAADILGKLLDHNPQNRLGVAGVAEVKSHAFFQNLDWKKLVQRGYNPVFRPDENGRYFHPYGVNYPYTGDKVGDRRENDQTYMSQNHTVCTGYPVPKSDYRSDWWTSTAGEKNDDWELVWLEDTKEFIFHNAATLAKEPVSIFGFPRLPYGDDVRDPSSPNLPTLYQKREAFGAAWKAGYERAMSQLPDYGINLSFDVMGDYVTAIEWVVKRGNIELTRTFLTKCGVQDSDRVALTRALGWAVDQENVPIVKLLLANGVRCEFEPSDNPAPIEPNDDYAFYADPIDPEGFMPPLVRAVKQGNIEIAKLLLAQGADANTDYHSFAGIIGGYIVRFTCGRVVQLAMEMEHMEMVDLLLRSGADIWLPQPLWDVPGHECGCVPRGLYQKVTAALCARAKELEEVH